MLRDESTPMIPWLLRYVGPLRDSVDAVTPGDSRVFLTARLVAAAVTAFAAALLFGPPAIRWLRGRFRERVLSSSPTLDALHAGKRGTPTMGGLFVVAAVLLSGGIWADLREPLVLLGLGVTAAFALLGAADDWVKLRTAANGLTPREKFAVQAGLAAAAGLGLLHVFTAKSLPVELRLPVGGLVLPLGLAFVPWCAVVTASSSNGMNLTDGLDGLASGCAVVAAGVLAGLAYLAGHAVWSAHLAVPHVAGAGELAVLLAAAAGAMLGFLWFNGSPAEVFMGDTGSLSVGALLGFAAVAVRQEVAFLVLAGVFAAETLSVVVQIGGYRLTGRRVLACSPLHNHFVFRGVPEPRIVTRFWIASAVCAAAALGTLSVR